MTFDQFAVEAARTRDNLVTTPQAEAEMQRGRSEAIARAQSAQAEYEAWLGTEAGRAAQEHAKVIALHLAFDAGYGARDEWLRHEREALTERVNHDDKLFEQLCADDAEALKAHEDDTYFTRYGL